MKRFAYLVLLFIFTASPDQVFAQKKGGKGKDGKKKVVYKKYTEYDLSGETVQGKLRAPEVFYIFQRKRSEGHQIVRTPSSLSHHRKPTIRFLKGAIPK